MSPAPSEHYKIGDRDERPWGSYVVTGVGIDKAGEEYCTKDITIKPWNALSLQSHNQRRERWTVKQGSVTVVLDDKRVTLERGQSIDIPLRAIHCMANLTDTFCVVGEIQEGVCREADIKRYVDASGRPTEALNTRTAQASIAHYRAIMEEIERTGRSQNAAASPLTRPLGALAAASP